MDKLTELFENNRNWSDKIKAETPNFFKDLSEGQSPDYLWIGCSDSRVPANQIVDLPPGNLFVHRNIANVVLHSDLNCQSVLQYAVEALKVKHIVICGHYGCGGVSAAFEGQSMGLIDHWLRHIQDTINEYQEKIKDIDSEEEKIDRLCEINVYAQVMNVCHSPIVRGAWKSGQELSVHGLIYDIETGRLQDLDLSISSLEEISSYEQV